VTVLPLDMLPVGFYAVGVLTPHGEEIDIYRASPALVLNVATGLPVASLFGWRRSLPRVLHIGNLPIT
jgi:hypothetical protein